MYPDLSVGSCFKALALIDFAIYTLTSCAVASTSDYEIVKPIEILINYKHTLHSWLEYLISNRLLKSVIIMINSFAL